MSIHQLPTVYKDNVELAVSRDLPAHADLVLDVAIKAAIEALRSPVATPAYRFERAVLLLSAAEASADRILGRTTR